jgi:hypothetical protein
VVGVREHVRADLAAAQLAQDAPAGVAGARVHQHVLDQEDVDDVRRELA